MSLIDSMQSYLAGCTLLAAIACAKTPVKGEGASVTYTGMQIQKRFLNGGWLACHSFMVHMRLYYASESERKQAQTAIEEVLQFVQQAQALPQLDEGQAVAIQAQKGTLSWDDDNGAFALLDVEMKLYVLHECQTPKEGAWFVSTGEGYKPLGRGIERLQVENAPAKTCFYDMYAQLQRVMQTDKKQANITGVATADGALQAIQKSAQEHTSLALVQVCGPWENSCAQAVCYSASADTNWQQSTDSSGVCPFAITLWLTSEENGTFSYTENEQGEKEYAFSPAQTDEIW